MKSVLVLICVLLALNVFSQDKYLSISQSEFTKEAVYKENTRIRVKTVEGGKLSGKFQFVDESEIMIKNIVIPISSISGIKHNPLLLNLLISGGFIIGGGFGVILGVTGVALGAPFLGIALGVAGIALVYTGIKAPIFLPYAHVKNNNVKVVNMLQ